MTPMAPGIVRNLTRAVAAAAFAFCILHSALPSSAQTPPPPAAPLSVPVLAPGLHGQRLPRGAGPTIHYTISIPPGYSPTAKVPLILALHFGGNPVGAGRAIVEILIGPALADLGAIIVAPDSLGAGWNNPENEEQVEALLGAVGRSYSVDPKRIVVAGFSMGGSGAWHWANKSPERFSAMIALAGRPAGDVASWRVPVFAVHSRADDVVPIGPTLKRIEELNALGKNARLVVVNGIPHYATGAYVGALREAVLWVRDVWRRAAPK